MLLSGGCTHEKEPLPPHYALLSALSVYSVFQASQMTANAINGDENLQYWFFSEADSDEYIYVISVRENRIDFNFQKCFMIIPLGSTWGIDLKHGCIFWRNYPCTLTFSAADRESYRLQADEQNGQIELSVWDSKNVALASSIFDDDASGCPSNGHPVVLSAPVIHPPP